MESLVRSFDSVIIGNHRIKTERKTYREERKEMENLKKKYGKKEKTR